MEQNADRRALDRSLAERLFRELLRTPPLKEALLLYMKDINPKTAPGLAKAVLWEDPALFMSLFGALPDAVNWLLEFLAELGGQLGGLPAPLLQDFVGVIGSRIDMETLEALPGIYAPLLKRLLVEDGQAQEKIVAISLRALNASLAASDGLTAGMEADEERRTALALARGIDGLDAEALGRISARLLRLANDARRLRSTKGTALRSFLAEADPLEASSLGGAVLRGLAAAAALLLAWGLRGLLRGWGQV